MENRVRSIALIGGVAVVAVVLLMAQRGQAQMVASDLAAGYVVFPKVVVDSADRFGQGRKVDTLIQLTNTAEGAGADTGCRVVECTYVDATKHCANNGLPCRTSLDCAGGTCGRTDDCQVKDFPITLSAGQAIGWSADSGATVPDVHCGTTSLIPPTASFFVGELKCVEVSSEAGPPLNANDLKGEATIYEVAVGVAPAGGVDVRSYNGIGVQATKSDLSDQSPRCVGGTVQGHTCTLNSSDCGVGGTCSPVLCLGANSATGAVCPTATYAGCPSQLILNHWFDGASNGGTCAISGANCESNAGCPGTGDSCTIRRPITTDLTLVPCTEDLGTPGVAATPATTVQFLIYNEFEQRFSSTTSVRCFKEARLAQLDTLPGQENASIFSFAVQGTLVGQTTIRPVNGTELDKGHGLLGIAEEFSHGTDAFPRGSDAFDLHYSGRTSGKADVVTLPVSVP